MGKFDHTEKFDHRYLNGILHHHPSVADCFNSLGLVTQDKGMHEPSLIWFHKALDVYKQLQNQTLIADTISNIALVYFGKEDYRQAIAAYNEALAICIKEFGIDHEKVAKCYDGIGAVNGKVNRYSEALTFKKMALAIREKHFPADHPDLGQSNTCIGTTYMSLGDFESAMWHYNKSIQIYEKSIPSDHPRFAMTFKQMENTYENTGDLKKAKHYYKKVAAIYHHLFRSNNVDVMDIEERIKRVSK
ncbi:unnamed protein product [Rotaria magnacalcarata]|uniref:Uncharacterized protein n=1 Tax=Rotaria magnacalcarata TaxID=392030 RepID=A0A816YBS8_9BILA|nr:unnamed protein product [Rotaria magnacalcarata]CAF1380041.1 unnamed protein product [Rotaria magnacalcarata]CAF2035372.1 unnamed protein product [Rotaria magnacalcarata]CAF2081414.1 unnamed protein product [Rotaria magnacalcarata]CAF2157276.1 unnamed protein product [Rotaria magnacalcarata]